MNLDIRTPMGLMFTLLGAVIAVFGLISNSNKDLYSKSLNININLWWGLVMVAFGLTMLALAFRAGKAAANAPAQKREDSDQAPASVGH
jgi:membrane-bound ClpP family serine protease